MKVHVVVKNNIEVIQRILQIFTRRGYELRSLSVETKGKHKHVTIDFPGDDEVKTTVINQLEKLVDTVNVS